jgi:hypothetical protein
MIASVGRMMRKGGGGLSWPAGMKEHIKAWYDPKKQGMTNYDVIEAYVEYFTYWTLDNTGITSTPKKIVIPAGTELKYVIAFRGFNSFTAGFDIKYTGNAVITYRYNKEDGTVGTIAIDKSGIYHLPASIKAQKNFGFYCNPQTVTEEATIEQLPTSILKDLSGNGNHAYLYGGKGKLNSGMGLYKVDFTSLRKSSVQTEVKPDVIKVTPNTSNYLFVQYANSVEIPSYKIKVIGLGDNVLKYQYAAENGRKEINIVEGENELPTSIKVSNDYQIGYKLTPGTSVFTITQIPDYPDQLCYDGKMYAVCYGFPILTDYTVMAERTWFERQNRACFLSKITTSGTGAFGFEFYNEYNEDTTYSFGRANNVEYFKDGITYQITNSYNGIVKLDYIVNGKDNAELYIGKLRPSERSAFIGCHGKIIIADRSFTEDEITWLKDNLFRK